MDYAPETIITSPGAFLFTELGLLVYIFLEPG